MLKSFTVNDINELEQLKQKLYESMDKTLLQISSNITSTPSKTLFSKMKFGGIGFDPLDSMNYAEETVQVNLVN